MPRKISRAKAKSRGLTRYYTGKKCCRGHVAERNVCNKHCVICGLAHTKAYQQTPQGQRTRRAWEESPRGRESQRRSNQSPEARASKRRYNRSQKGREARRRFDQSPKGRESRFRQKHSVKGHEATRRRNNSPRGQDCQWRYKHSTKGIETARRYAQRYNEQPKNKRRVLEGVRRRLLERREAEYFENPHDDRARKLYFNLLYRREKDGR